MFLACCYSDFGGRLFRKAAGCSVPAGERLEGRPWEGIAEHSREEHRGNEREARGVETEDGWHRTNDPEASRREEGAGNEGTAPEPWTEVEGRVPTWKRGNRAPQGEGEGGEHRLAEKEVQNGIGQPEVQIQDDADHVYYRPEPFSLRVGIILWGIYISFAKPSLLFLEVYLFEQY